MSSVKFFNNFNAKTIFWFGLNNKNTGLLLLLLLGTLHAVKAQKRTGNIMQVGVATIDITPEWPVRLAGFAVRVKREADGTAQPLRAKALAFGHSYQTTAVLLTADLIGISSRITDSVKKRLLKKVDPNRVTISVSHTHSGPEIGSLLNILSYTSAKTAFSDTLLPAAQIGRINLYVEQLVDKLTRVALEALQARAPAIVSWGKGHVDFSYNRRNLINAVDHDVPIIKITDVKGNLKAVFLSYACHAVSLGPGFNQYHGDWVGDAQLAIEERHPGTVAMIGIGCAGDSNPKPISIGSNSGSIMQEGVRASKKYGSLVADEVDSLVNTQLRPLILGPVVRIKKISLPFDHVPTVQELNEQAKDITVKGYYARLALDRIARGEKIAESIVYPVQTWSFGKQLNMIFLGGEVVADYSIRLKNELGSASTWVVAYSNDVPCYIGSKRVIRAGNYEGETSMYYYNKPSRLKESVEDQIIETVHQLLKK